MPLTDLSDPSQAHPVSYDRGVELANRIIATRPGAVRPVVEQIEYNRRTYRLTQRQYAISSGLVHTLREYLQERADV